MILDEFNGQDVKEEKTLDTKIDQGKPYIADIDEDWITFGNIRCYDMNGDVFESYGRVQLARKDFYASEHFFSSSHAQNRLENDSFFLPSTALTYQCLVQLYLHRNNSACRRVLDQYHKENPKLHFQNTAVDWHNGKILHYPRTGHLNFVTHKNESNQSSIHEFKWHVFNRTISTRSVIEIPQVEQFIQKITGGTDVSLLLEMEARLGSGYWRSRDGSDPWVCMFDMAIQDLLEYRNMVDDYLVPFPDYILRAARIPLE